MDYETTISLIIPTVFITVGCMYIVHNIIARALEIILRISLFVQ